MASTTTQHDTGTGGPGGPRGRRVHWRRALLPALVLGVFLLVVAPVAGTLSGKLTSVTENDQAAFLPDSAESTRSLELETAFAGDQDIPALLVWERPGGLAPEDLAAVEEALARVAAVDGLAGPVSPPVPSEDGEAVQAVVPLPGDNSAFETLPGVVEDIAAAAAVDGLPSYVTGPGGQFADFAAAFEGIDGRLLVTTVSVVLVILLLIYRSPVFVPVLLSAGIALVVAQAVVYLLADADVLTVDGQSQGILSVLVLGAGTDYALLLISRFKEELHREDSWSRAMRTALRGAFPPILASAATVILGLLCLLLSDLNSNKSLGPVGAIGIAASLLAMTVLLPALLMVAGRYWFFPFVPRHDEVVDHDRGFWGRVAGLVGRRARAVAAVTTVVLAGAALFTTQLDASGLTTEEQFTTEVDSVAGQEVLARHFPAGTGVPVSVIGPQEEADRLVDVVAGVPGVAQAALRTPSPDGTGEPVVVDGQVQVQALLEDASDSPAAEGTVLRLRSAVDEVGTDVLVGGGTAVLYDVQQESARDTRVIIPAILVVVFLVLTVLLRSLLAPLLLVATVVLSFLATLGVCALVFEHVFGFAGADPSFPLFAFVFLVALGIDYNIFLMTRVREESQVLGTRRGTLVGLAVTGGVITSAGVVLAATFSALGVLPLVFLAELGFAVAFGVLLDTLVVRSLLVPALVHELGDRTWWPVGLRREPAPAVPPLPRQAGTGSA
ncbi:MMPL family transporter [Vallicoccus soli]|uniref:MMPL family transporter n=1 Tax=Vallicoccus soli TaxID=2339232 RepID=A0A3A3YWF4_9ACTN|nr:MMPL family transporter [Vallicoccus soli]RJK94239.1 MMPL family transporter [Vallicoccus soli]